MGFIEMLAKRRKGADARTPKAASKGEEDDKGGVAVVVEGGDYSDVEESALADMVEAMDLDDDKAEAFGTALGQYVESCVKRAIDELEE